jgi:hypothetical protein
VWTAQLRRGGTGPGRVCQGKKYSEYSQQMKLVEAWIEIHKEELPANWELAAYGQEIFH